MRVNDVRRLFGNNPRASALQVEAYVDEIEHRTHLTYHRRWRLRLNDASKGEKLSPVAGWTRHSGIWQSASKNAKNEFVALM